MVNIVRWEKEYEVGVKEIDSQHKTLVAIINDLYGAFMQKEEESKIDETISKLFEFTEFHFNCEIEYFRKYNFTGIESHIAIHNDFIQQLSEMKEKHESTDYDVTFELINFMRKWLVEHVCKADKMAFATFKSRISH